MNFSNLDPQQVLASLDAVGLRGDGRILQLNSYENRVFQVFLEDGRVVVAKFYRPGRWRDAQIVEEHAFALELAEAEVPVVPPLELHIDVEEAGLQLHGHPPTLACRQTPEGLHRYTAALRCAGREPELEDPAALRQLGRFIGRLHSVGKRRPFVHRHHLNARVDGRLALQSLLQGGFVPDTERPAWQQACMQALDGVEAAFDAVEVWNGRNVDVRAKVLEDLLALLRTSHPVTAIAATPWTPIHRIIAVDITSWLPASPASHSAWLARISTPKAGSSTNCSPLGRMPMSIRSRNITR